MKEAGMHRPSRRHLIKSFAGMGAFALWGNQTALAAEKGETLTANNGSDTIRDIQMFRIKTIRMRKTAPYFIWVRIRTENGLVGFGECYTVESSERWIAKYMQSLKGRNVSDLINRFYLEALKDYDASRSSRESMGWCSGISCLEIALWDILGKMADQPVHALLGGAVRDRIPLYANHAIFKGEGPSQIDRILHAKELGFEMFKWDPFFGAPEDEKKIRKQVESVETARAALGPEYKIAIDAHRRWNSLKGPKIAATAMEPLDITFFEEPVHHREANMFVELSKSTNIPLASGEIMTHHDEVRDLLQTGALTHFQPDVGNFGGIAATKNACHFADAYGVKISTHNWSGPLSTMAAVQFTAVIPNLLRQEWPHLGYGQQWESEIVSPQLSVKQGHLEVPQGPGIGVVPDIAMLEKRKITD
jgi:galactonate dehydratase